MEQEGELNQNVPKHIRLQITLVSYHTFWKIMAVE